MGAMTGKNCQVTFHPTPLMPLGADSVPSCQSSCRTRARLRTHSNEGFPSPQEAGGLSWHRHAPCRVHATLHSSVTGRNSAPLPPWPEIKGATANPNSPESSEGLHSFLAPTCPYMGFCYLPRIIFIGERGEITNSLVWWGWVRSRSLAPAHWPLRRCKGPLHLSWSCPGNLQAGSCHPAWALRGSSIKRILKPFNT